MDFVAFVDQVITLLRQRGRLTYRTLAWALRLLGDIVMHCDPPEARPAEAHYRQALTLAEELGTRPLQAHATVASARCMPRPAGNSRPTPLSPPPLPSAVT